MKRAASIGLTLFLAVLLAACAGVSSIKAGSATAQALVKLLPKSTGGVIALDVHRAMSLAATAKALENPVTKEKYDEFIKMAGIDPMKDVYLLVLGFTGAPNAMTEDGAAIVNLKYQKDRLLGIIKEKAPDSYEELYNGVTIYANLDGDKDKQTTWAAFLDDSNIVFGSQKGVKGIIDVYQKKAESAWKNAALTGKLKKVDQQAIAWGAFAVPPDLIKKGAQSTPQLKVLEGVTALTFSFDVRLSNYIADIRTLGGTKEQNDELAKTVTGLKAMGGMLAGQEPAVGDFLKAVEITSGKDYTRLYISVGEELMDKLGKLAQEYASKFIKVTKDEPQGEIR